MTAGAWSLGLQTGHLSQQQPLKFTSTVYIHVILHIVCDVATWGFHAAPDIRYSPYDTGEIYLVGTLVA